MLRLVHPTAPLPDHSDDRWDVDGPRGLAVAGDRAFTLEGGERVVARGLPSGEIRWTRPIAGHLLAASLEGDLLAVATRRALWLLDSASGEPVAEHALDFGATCLAISPTGALAAGTFGGEVHAHVDGVWQRLGPTGSRITALAHTGAAVVAGCADGSLHRLDPGGGEPAVLCARDHAVSAVAIGPDDSLLAAWADGTVLLWSKRDGQRPRSFPGAAGPIVTLAHHAGQVLAAGEERLIHRWDAGSATPTSPLAGHQRPILGMGVDGEGRLWTAAKDRQIRRWDPAGAVPWPHLSGHGGGVRACVVQGDRAFTGSRDGSVRQWSLASGRPLATWIRGHSAVTALSATPRGGLVAGRSDGSLTCMSEPGHTGWTLRRAHKGPVTSLGAWDDLVVSGGADGSLRIWDLASGAPVSARHDHGARLRCLALAPGGDLLATGSYDGGVAIGAPLGSAALARGQGHEGPVVGCAWVGDRLVSVGMDGTLRSWSAGAEPTACVAAHTDGAVGVAALSNDQLITVGGDGRVCLWRLNAAGDASLDHELDLGVALDGLGAETQTGRAPRLLVGDRYGGAHAIELRR